MKTPESFEKDIICKYLKLHGFWFFKPATYGFGKSGVGDIVACIEGAFWNIEVKRRDNIVPSKLQMTRISEIRSAGGMATWGTAFKVCAEIDTWRAVQAKQRAVDAAYGEHAPKLLGQ